MPFLDEDGVTRLTEDYLDIFAQKNNLDGDGLAYHDDKLNVDSLTAESDGAISGPIAELTAKGHAEQFSTTGKNLLPDNFEFWNASDNSKNGTSDYTWSRTTTGAAAGSIISSDSVTEIGSTYVLSFDAKAASVLTLHSEFHGGNGGDVSIGTDWARYQIFVKRNESTNRLYIWPTTNNIIVNVKNIQLEFGSTATAYEPYTGGAPSPSPDYPQEIKVARGRNLLDASTAIIDKAWNLSNNSARAIINVEVEPSTTYTISNISGGFNPLYVYEKASASDTTYITNYDVNAQVSRTITTSASTRYLCVQFNKDVIGLSDIMAEQIQLELGSTPTPYVPYGHVGLEVRGKNLLLNSGPDTHTHNGVTYRRNDDGSVTVNGTATGEYSTYPIANTSQTRSLGLIQGQTYTISSANLPSNVYVQLYDAVGHVFRDTFTFGGLGSNPNVSIYVSVGTTVNNLTIYPMLNVGSTALPYQPYLDSTTPIPLPQRGWVAGLPDGTADTLTIDGSGHVEWRKNTISTNGSEVTWIDNGSSDGYRRVIAPFSLMRNGQASDGKTNGNVINNPKTVMATTSSVRTRVGGNYIEVMDYPSTMSLSDISTALANVPFLHILAIPVTEECGYIDLPDIPSDATVSIPELENLGVRFWIDKSGSIKATLDAYKSRISNERAEDLSLVEDAVVELAADALPKTKYYFGYDKVGNRNMLSIFRRGE